MLKKGIIVVFFLFSVLLLNACQQKGDNSNHQSGEDSELLEPRVEMIVAEKANKNEDVPIAAKVYYGEELVDDAEVRFEMKHGEESEEVDAELTETGTYEISYQFKEDGIYTIIAHTDVRKIHTMPSKDIQIGDGEQESVQTEQMDEEEEAHHHHE